MAIKKTGFALEQLVAQGIYNRLQLLPDVLSRQRVLAAVKAYSEPTAFWPEPKQDPGAVYSVPSLQAQPSTQGIGPLQTQAPLFK
jgi:hypothetical protein